MPRLKRIAEVLGLAGHLPIFELHDAHRVRRLPVVSKDEFSDPEVGSAEDAPHGEALHARLCEARRLNIAPAADALGRLRILKHSVLSVDLVFQLEVIRVGYSPVGIQCRSNLPVFHFNLPSLHRCTPLVPVTLSSVERPRAADEPIPANVEAQEAVCRARDADPSALPDFAGYLSVGSEAQRTVPTKVDSIQPAINSQGYAQPSRASRQVSHLFGAAILPHHPNAASRLDRPDQDACAYAWHFARDVEHE